MYDCLALRTLVADALQALHEEGDETATCNAAIKVGGVAWVKHNKVYFTKSGASRSYPSMEHRKHTVHVASLALLLVSVCTISLQEGHWVMADL